MVVATTNQTKLVMVAYTKAVQQRIEVIGRITIVAEVGIAVTAGIVAAGKVIDPLVASLAVPSAASLATLPLASWFVAAWRFASCFSGWRPRALPAFAIYDNIRSIR